MNKKYCHAVTFIFENLDEKDSKKLTELINSLISAIKMKGGEKT